MYTRFKKGVKVRLNPNKVDQHTLRSHECSGVFDRVYIIDVLDKGSYLDVHLNDSNWHRSKWLDIILEKNVVGGKLI